MVYPKKGTWPSPFIGKKHGKVLSTLACACNARAYNVDAYRHYLLSLHEFSLPIVHALATMTMKIAQIGIHK